MVCPIRLQTSRALPLEAPPNGEVWLQRPRAQDDGAFTYDVFNRKGLWQRAVEFPKGASLAGFGPKGAIYGSIKAGDGSRTVGRFKLK